MKYKKVSGDITHWNCNLCGKPLKVRRTSKGKLLWKEGHNADPLAEGFCCDVCNQKVLEARGAPPELSMMAYMPMVHIEKDECPYLKGAKFTIDSHHDYRTIVGTFPTLCNANTFSRLRLNRSHVLIERVTVKNSTAKRKPKVWVVKYKPAEYDHMWRFNADDVLTELDEMMP